VAGSRAAAHLLELGSFDVVASVVDSGVSFDVGGNLTLSVGGNLLVQGGGHDQSGALLQALGNDNSARALVSSRVDISAGGNLAITVKKGSSVTMQAGSHAGQGQTLETGFGSAGPANHLSEDMDAGVALTAGGALSLTGAATVALTAGQPGTSINILQTKGPVSVVSQADVTLTGKTVNLNNNVGITTTSFGTDVIGSLIQQATVTVMLAGVAPFDFAPESTLPGLGTLGERGLPVQLETVLAPAASATGATATAFNPGAMTTRQGPFPSSCAVLLLKAELAQRCSVGGR